MAKVLNLYMRGTEPVGTATFDKAKNAYKVVYNESIYYDNEFIPLEDFEEYKNNRGLNSLAGEQVTLEDLL
ncbi:hypothetical protein [Jeotgalicoccus sp. S0W5]|uniref:hypothetical protein n=1 Tax=Jeotgalicoccus sp. S0W5 TaxID=2527874 RepID=UPI001414E9D9|nr:hypothetical protein [Jeotgalicoccus sp. S0W5]